MRKLVGGTWIRNPAECPTRWQLIRRSLPDKSVVEDRGGADAIAADQSYTIRQIMRAIDTGGYRRYRRCTREYHRKALAASGYFTYVEQTSIRVGGVRRS